jgi:hypothetical protein
MGKDTPFITEGDGEADVEISLIEACGLEYEKYAKNDSILTRSILESNFNELVEIVKSMNHHVAYLILGTLILKTGSKLPDDLKKKLLEAADWENERKLWKYASKGFLELRKEVLIDFQEKVKNHKAGIITDITSIE